MWEVSSPYQQQVLWIALRNVGGAAGTANAVIAGATWAARTPTMAPAASALATTNYGFAVQRSKYQYRHVEQRRTRLGTPKQWVIA